MTFTVVIPTKNRRPLLQRAIESVLAQSYGDFELVVIDDASIDDTATYVEGLSDPRVKLHRSSRPLGASGARNTGIRLATGEWIAFLDSDDTWRVDKLQRNAELAATLPAGSRWLAFNSVEIVVNGQTRKTEPKVGPRPGESIGDYILGSQGFIQTSAIFGPRAFLQSLQFDTALAPLEDWDLYLRAEADGAGFRFQPLALTIHNADDRSDRISRQLPVAIARDWLARHEAALSSVSQQRFRMLRLAPAMKGAGQHLAASRVALRSSPSLMLKGRLPGRALLSILLKPRLGRISKGEAI